METRIQPALQAESSFHCVKKAEQEEAATKETNKSCSVPKLNSPGSGELAATVTGLSKSFLFEIKGTCLYSIKNR